MVPQVLAAHSPGPDGGWHPLSAHLEATGVLAAEFGALFGSAEVCGLVGRLHDIGKADPAWQTYLAAAARGVRAERVDHKHAGAILLERLEVGTCSCVIAGHHGGMPDNTDLRSNIFGEPTPGQQAAIEYGREQFLSEWPDRNALIPARFRPSHSSDRAGWRRLELWLRMVFSALVDADWLDTEAHFRPGLRATTPPPPRLAELDERCGVRRAAAIAERERDPVASARAELFAEAMSKADQPPGWFELTAPTGSGKTITALSFALQHAAVNGLRRVITAVPFISVTEQVAGEYRKLLDADGVPVVLEHHSGVSANPQSSFAADLWARLATQNWDVPVVVTTMVQLLESLFSNRPSAARKLHNIVGSVLVLDEVQSLPWRLLEPTLDVLRELIRSYGCSVIFSTATQPPFEKIGSIDGIQREQLCHPGWFSVFDRTDAEVIPEPLSWDALAQQVVHESRNHHGQCLVVLNTIGNARELCKHLEGLPGLSHLSSRLCPAHRLEVLADMKSKLRAGQPCTLISTQLVEAGIDVDFPVGIRAFGPIPSIAQVAGRINRHGIRARGRLVLVDPAQGRTPPHEYAIGTQIARQLLLGGSDPLDPTTISVYYDRLIFATNDKFDLYQIQNEREHFNFQTVARKYRVIADDTQSVIVRYGNFDPAQDLNLPDDPKRRRARFQQLQRYTVSLRMKELEKVEHLIDKVGDGVWIWQGTYHPVYGLMGDHETEENNW